MLVEFCSKFTASKLISQKMQLQNTFLKLLSQKRLDI